MTNKELQKIYAVNGIDESKIQKVIGDDNGQCFLVVINGMINRLKYSNIQYPRDFEKIAGIYVEDVSPVQEKQTLLDKVEDFKEKVEEKFEDLKDNVEDKVEDLKDKVEDKVEELKEVFGAKIEDVMNIFGNKEAETATETVTDVVTETTNEESTKEEIQTEESDVKLEKTVEEPVITKKSKK
jgi:uncharacterized protein YjbJ (UPF0337 family)